MKQNGLSNLVKFLFSMCIILLHCGMEFGFLPFQGSWIFVEWFFVFSGFTLAKGILTPLPSPEEGGIVKRSFKVFVKRIRAIYPYYFISVILGIIVKLAAGSISFVSARDVLELLGEFLMLQMTGIKTAYITGVTWFLSSMWIAMLLIIPLEELFRHKFTRFAGILIPVGIYLYLYKKTGYLWEPLARPGIFMKGNLRAFAGITLGGFAYEVSDFLAKRKSAVTLEEGNTSGASAGFAAFGRICKVLVPAAYLGTIVFAVCYDDSALYFLFPFLFALLIAVSMAQGMPQAVPDNKVTRVLGRISMATFLNHYYWVLALKDLFSELSFYVKTVLVILLCALSTSVVFTIKQTTQILHDRRTRT